MLPEQTLAVYRDRKNMVPPNLDPFATSLVSALGSILANVQLYGRRVSMGNDEINPLRIEGFYQISHTTPLPVPVFIFDLTINIPTENYKELAP